ncbi:hypothetical protein [Levilactobacillus spicheri]|uniref:hypothetical protein n=1 Tax=Levilactobacillus spicheri TaxID=216463 RepID=UPI000AB57E04|nr:hypothetical protein [Levilactobacillus spicheri]
MVINHRNCHRLGQAIVILLVVLGVTTSSAQAAQNEVSNLSRNSENRVPSNFQKFVEQTKVHLGWNQLNQSVKDKFKSKLDEAEKDENPDQVRDVIQEALSSNSESSEKTAKFDGQNLVSSDQPAEDSKIQFINEPNFSFVANTSSQPIQCVSNDDQVLRIYIGVKDPWTLTARLGPFIKSQSSADRAITLPAPILVLHMEKKGNESIPIPHADTKIIANGSDTSLVDGPSANRTAFSAICNNTILDLPEASLPGEFKATLTFTIYATPKS